MKEGMKSAEELSVELADMRRKVAELEAAVADRKSETDALRASETRYRELFNNMRSGVAVYEAREDGKDFIFKDFNRAGEDIDGQSKDELIGKGLLEMRPGVKDFGLLDIFRKVWKTGEPMRHPIKLYEDERLSAWYENFVYKLPSGEIVAIFDNISAQKQAEQVLRESEERWQFALEGAGDGVWDWNAQTNQVFFSHQWKAMLGYEDHEIGNSLEEWDTRLHPDDHDAVYAELQKHFAGQTSIYTSEHRLQCKDGSYKWILDRGKVIRWTEDHTPWRVIGTHTDITTRKHMEESLRESEERFRQVYVHMTVGLARVSLDFRIEHANEAYCRMLGYREEELIGKHLREITHPEVVEENLRKQSQLATGEIDHYRMEKQFIHKDGGVVYGILDANVIRDASGKALYFLGSLLDITERKRAEDALQRSERLYRTLARNFPNGAVMLFDRDLRYLIADGTGLTEAGLSSQEMEGKTIWEVFPPETCAAIEADYRSALAGKYTGNEVAFAEHDYYTQTLPVKDSTGKIIAGMVMTQDITERKQMEEALRESEEKLRTLFGAMTEMVALHEVVYNEQGKAIDYRITDCNPTFTAVTGIPREAAVGKLATEVYQADTAPYLEEYTRVARTGEPYEFTVYYPPMDKHFMISVVSPQQGHFATVTTDITAIKQIQTVISAKNKELENYLYVASHDLRSPLVNIQGFSQRLQKQTKTIEALLAEHPFEESEKQQTIEQLTEKGIPKSLNFIFTNVSKMDTLINGLLKISRTGRVKMSIQKINMSALLEKIVRTFSFQLEEAGAEIVLEDLPECYGDETLLDQLFSNLIGNALKYRETNRQLLVTIRAQMQHQKVLFCIRDTGIGIARRHLDKIWDVFYQVDSQAPEAGEGIGLSIVKRIVDKHKGKIWVESEEGAGSVFYVELPGVEFSE